MANMQTMNQPGYSGDSRQMAHTDWSGEVTRGGMMPAESWGWENGSMTGQTGGQMQSGQMAQFRGGQMSQGNRSSGLSMRNDLPAEVVESPTSMGEAYMGSLKAMLNRNKGNYIVATFLIGTQNLSSWEGVLYDVGNDYVTIYQPGRDRYVVIDVYSLKYIEFYDTRRQQLCDQMLRERGL